MGGAKPPTCLRAFPGPGAGQTSKMHPHKSGQTAFRYPENRNLWAGDKNTSKQNGSCGANAIQDRVDDNADGGLRDVLRAPKLSRILKPVPLGTFLGPTLAENRPKNEKN